MKLLEKDPDVRYKTANETARAIAHLILTKYPELAHEEPYIWLKDSETYARERISHAEAA